MSDNWDFFFLRVDDQPASIFVDLGIAAEAPLATHPHMAYVSVTMRHPRDDGLSSQEEFADLCKLEDAIVPEICAENAIFVGRNTSAGHRDFYFYSADASHFVETAKSVMGRHSAYSADVGARPDPTWSVYFDFLSPSPDDRQRMGNRHVREALVDRGDSLSAPRQIDHWAYFLTRDGAAAFVVRIGREGFRPELPRATDKGDYVVRFARDDRPDELDDATVMLARLARELGGDYDGWECPVTPEPD